MPQDVPLSLTQLPTLLRTSPEWSALESALTHGNAGTIDSAWGSSISLAAAALAQANPSTLLVVLAHPGDLIPWSHDLHSFCGSPPTLFPGWEIWPPERSSLDEVPGQRLRLLQRLSGAEPPRVVLTTITALLQPVPSRQELAARARLLKRGTPLDLEDFALWLVNHGFRRVDAVELPGEFSRRGGIFDVWSPDGENPARLEFFGDDIDSIRLFSSGTQRSLGEVPELMVLGLKAPSDGFKPLETSAAHLCDYLPPQSWIALTELEELRDQARHFLERVTDSVGLFSFQGTFQLVMKFPNIVLSAMPRASAEVSVHLQVESIERFSGNVAKVRDELDGIAREDRVLIACQNEAEIKRLTDVLAAGQLAESARLRLVTGSVKQGFRLVSLGIVVAGSHELFHREQTAAGEKATVAGLPKRRIESRAIDSFLELKDNDYVVHLVHGIAIYRGMRMLDRRDASRSQEAAEGSTLFPEGMPQAPVQEEHLVLEFRDGVRVYIPVSKIDLIQKYVGGSKSEPELSKLGGSSWAKKKEKVLEAVQDLASDMIELQAMRATQAGHSFPVDSDWQKEFEGSFPFQETPDQLTAISELKKDLQRPRPMDRLLCGDVGYGKTEVALRAAFKVADNGKQVAVLVPTTVLAEQHFRTFTQRLAEYPFHIEVLSRFRTKKEQKATLEGLASGGVDIVIGTHRIVSQDVKFKDLGLVIIDEEQRFGVEHKERLKQIRALVHVLTMTATPIPRTLHQGLLGIRDISSLETPPPERLPVETRIIRWDEKLIRAAILRELNRDGQIYFVHNRVMDIAQIGSKIQAIVPEAKIVIGHGQMGEHELEKAMMAFIRKEAHILLATTIIESGVDIPNSNTIFINEADHYGLADLHQLRGRVGRLKNRAYAYLILDSKKVVSETAAKRLKAIEEFTELGAGFKIAMRDLEIRGAGNILGEAQSGHIASVGYELYCQLLENAVRAKKNMPLRTPLEANVDLPWPAWLPREYVPGQKLRMEVYRRLARLRNPARIEDFRQELRDRYGPLPEPAEWLLKQGEIRLLAALWQIASIHQDNKDLVLTYRFGRMAQELVTRSKGRFKIIDEKSIYLRLREGEEEAVSWYPLLKELLQPPAGMKFDEGVEEA